MAGNDFDPTVMPSANAARVRQRRMLVPAPVYPAIAVLIGLAIFLAISIGAAGR
jgi:hypothetical protein